MRVSVCKFFAFSALCLVQPVLASTGVSESEEGVYETSWQVGQVPDAVASYDQGAPAFLPHVRYHALLDQPVETLLATAPKHMQVDPRRHLFLRGWEQGYVPATPENYAFNCAMWRVMHEVLLSGEVPFCESTRFTRLAPLNVALQGVGRTFPQEATWHALDLVRQYTAYVGVAKRQEHLTLREEDMAQVFTGRTWELAQDPARTRERELIAVLMYALKMPTCEAYMPVWDGLEDMPILHRWQKGQRVDIFKPGFIKEALFPDDAVVRYFQSLCAPMDCEKIQNLLTLLRESSCFDSTKKAFVVAALESALLDLRGDQATLQELAQVIQAYNVLAPTLAPSSKELPLNAHQDLDFLVGQYCLYTLSLHEHYLLRLWQEQPSAYAGPFLITAAQHYVSAIPGALMASASLLPQDAFVMRADFHLEGFRKGAPRPYHVQQFRVLKDLYAKIERLSPDEAVRTKAQETQAQLEAELKSVMGRRRAALLRSRL